MKLKPLVLAWLPLGVAILGLTSLVYLSEQQNLRQNANDPQIQLAEDAAARLASGVAPAVVVGTDLVDAGRSLAPFTIVFDAAGKAVASSGQLDGATPTPPVGTLEYAKAHGQNHFTWQPASGVRLAAVLTYHHQDSHTGYVLAARSLREVEVRESWLFQLCALAGAVMWLLSFGAVWLVKQRR